MIYNPTGTGPWYVAFGSASGYGTPINIEITGSPALIGNIIGGGQDGILAVHSGVWWYYAWNGSSFVGTSTGPAYDSTATQYQLADVDGNGRADLVALYITGPNGLGKYTATVYTRLNTSSGGTPSFSSTLSTANTKGSLVSAQLLTPDFRAAGVPQKNIDEYIDLLLKLDANEQIFGVIGTGEPCLIVADVLYGLFDNGIIKGYVFSPADPEPLVQDLEHWPSEMADAKTAYKLIGARWYLFVVRH